MAEMSARRKALSDRGVEEAIVSLKRGTHLLKCGRRGKPKFCTFRLSTDEKVLIWYNGTKEKQLKLNSVTTIIVGQQTVNFLRTSLLEKEDRSFSVIYQDGARSLDLICKDKEQTKSWILGLTALVSLYHHSPLVANVRNGRESLSCASSPVSHRRRKDSLRHIESSARFSQVHSLSGSPPQSLLQRHLSVGLSYSSHGPHISTPIPLSDTQTAPTIRLPHITHLAYHSFSEGLKLNYSSKRQHQVQSTKIKTLFSRPHLTVVGNALRDIFMWGEGIEGGILGGDLNRSSSFAVKSDALFPKLLDCTRMLDVRSISCGRKHAAIVTKQGAVFSWGEEYGGRLGHRVSMDVPNPKAIESLSGVSVEAVVCGANHTCALTSLGELYAWGDSGQSFGHLNDVNYRNKWIPHRFSGLLEGLHISKVACGEWHTALVTSSGQLFTFGEGMFGVLGHGDLQNIFQPKEVESLKGLGVKSVACGPWHTAAIVDIMTTCLYGNTHGGKLFTWGDNDKGRLGLGDKDIRFLPTCVPSVVDCDFVQVSCGNTLTVALTTSGMVFTMGSSEHGQLGCPQAEDKSVMAVGGDLRDKQVKQISSGSFHVAVLTTKGEVFTWGKGANGRLGLGDTEDRNSPALVKSLKHREVESVACGSSFTAAICLHDSLFSPDQSSCSGCKATFGFTRKKHNCYNCGCTFCHLCTSKKATNASLAPNDNKQFRVCDPCFILLKGSTYIRSEQEIQTPRLLSRAQKGFSGRKTDKEEATMTPLHAFSPNVYTIEKKLPFERQASIRQGKDKECEDMLHFKIMKHRWGGVSCPPLFTAFQRESSTKQSLFSNSDLSNSYNTDAQNPPSDSPLIKPLSISLKPVLKDNILTEELQRLRSEVQILTTKCRLKGEKLILYKQKVDETWSVARDEAAKCKAAKDIIQILTTQMNAMASRFSAGRELNNLKALLWEKLDIRSPQIRPLHTETFECGNVDYLLPTNSVPSDDKLPENRKENVLSALPNGPKQVSRNEWVKQDEPGVYLTFVNLPSGKKNLKRVRFSRRHFSEKDAERWWRDNQIRIYNKYDVDQI